MKRLLKILLLLLAALLLVTVLWRIKRQFVPAGAPIGAFLFHATDAKSVTSPEGHKLFYRFQKSDTKQAGNHHTWCYRKTVLLGLVLVAEGYSVPEVRNGEAELPVFWQDDGAFSIQFVDGPQDEIPSWFSAEFR